MALLLDDLTDADLASLNKQYLWVTGTLDSRGRILGRKQALYPFPHPKITAALTRLDLTGKSVVEFGGLEGAHTIELCRAARDVTTIEARQANIDKLRVRCGLYGVAPKIVKADIETELPPAADVFFHSGVLYHLQDPVGHLLRICPLTRELLLDTHHTKAPNTSYVCPVNGKEYDCWVYDENKAGFKSGLREFSRWLRLRDICETLKRFFHSVELADSAMEKNGPRTTIVAKDRKA